jgi:hypothetical protein
MRVPLSIGFPQAILRARADEGDMVLGSGAILHRSNGCVTLHAVGAASPRTRMPHARGAAPERRDPPETRRYETAQNEDGRAPRIAAGGDSARSNPVSLML